MSTATFRTIRYDQNEPHVRVYYKGWVVGITPAVVGMTVDNGAIEKVEGGVISIRDENGNLSSPRFNVLPIIEVEEVSYEHIKWLSESYRKDYLKSINA